MKTLIENAQSFMKIGNMNPLDLNEKLKITLDCITQANGWKQYHELAYKKILEDCNRYYQNYTLLEIDIAFDFYLQSRYDEMLDKRYRKIDAITSENFTKFMLCYRKIKNETGLSRKSEAVIPSEGERAKQQSKIAYTHRQFIFLLIEFIDYGDKTQPVYLNSMWMVDQFIKWGIVTPSEKAGIMKGDMPKVSRGEFKKLTADGACSNLIWSKINQFKEVGKSFMDLINLTGLFKVEMTTEGTQRTYRIESLR